jgi:hypothetical protein
LENFEDEEDERFRSRSDDDVIGMQKKSVVTSVEGADLLAESQQACL